MSVLKPAEEMDSSELTSTNWGYVWTLLSITAFTACNLLLDRVVPRNASQTPAQKWKWKNTAISLFHSAVSGTWSCLCFWQTPAMREDLISKYSSSAHGVVSLSTGYFIYDLIDILMNHRKRSSYELMLHHFFVILCFGLSTTTRFYVGYGLVALLVEINSVFLHLRQLMIIHSVSKSSMMYRFNSFMNLVTFIIFRIMTLCWMTRWLVLHRDELTATAFAIGSVSMAVVMVMNIFLFLRVLNSDYGRRVAKQTLLQEEDDDFQKAETKLKQ